VGENETLQLDHFNTESESKHVTEFVKVLQYHTDIAAKELVIKHW